jgi:MFS family permease
MNKDYYGLTSKEATKVQMWEGTISGIPSLIFMFFTGYVYDIIGVRYTLFIATLFAGGSLMLYPLGAPHLWILVTGSSLFGIGLDLIGSNTLIIDFVEV